MRSSSRKRQDNITVKDDLMTTPPKQSRVTPSRSNAVNKKTPTRTVAKHIVFPDSDDEMPTVVMKNQRREESIKEDDNDNQENNPYSMDELINEVSSISAIENYFMKGKNRQQNKSRRRRGKKDKRGEKDDEDHEEEDDDDDKKDKGDNRYAECDLNALRIFYEKSRKNEDKIINNLAEENFNKWTLYLSTGFNVLVHGLGSLRPLLHAYAVQMGEHYSVIEIEGFRPDCNPRSVLTTIYDGLHLKFPKKRSVLEWSRQIVDEIKDKEMDIIIVLHNIDSHPFRESGDMEVLQILALSPRFHFVSSCQHVNRMLLWSSRSVAPFQWVHIQLNTWLPAEVETFAGSSSLLGLSSTASACNHSLASLDVLWQSLNQNARFIFHAFFSLVYGTEETPESRSLSFWDLFNVSKENFWVSSDAALRQQLVEFSDHRLVRVRRGNDGNEKIYPSADRSIIDLFLKNVNMPLENMTIENEE